MTSIIDTRIENEGEEDKYHLPDEIWKTIKEYLLMPNNTFKYVMGIFGCYHHLNSIPDYHKLPRNMVRKMKKDSLTFAQLCHNPRWKKKCQEFLKGISKTFPKQYQDIRKNYCQNKNTDKIWQQLEEQIQKSILDIELFNDVLKK